MLLYKMGIESDLIKSFGDVETLKSPGVSWVDLSDDKKQELFKCALAIIEILDNKINDIDIYNHCSIDISENYDGKGMNVISISGDDGVIEFGIITNPTEFD